MLKVQGLSWRHLHGVFQENGRLKWMDMQLSWANELCGGDLRLCCHVIAPQMMFCSWSGGKKRFREVSEKNIRSEYQGSSPSSSAWKISEICSSCKVLKMGMNTQIICWEIRYGRRMELTWNKSHSIKTTELVRKMQSKTQNSCFAHTPDYFLQEFMVLLGVPY